MKTTASVFILTLLFSLNSAKSQVVTISECVLEKGALKDVQLQYNQGTGEKTIVVNNVKKPFDSVYTEMGKPYAANEAWYINGDAIKVKGSHYRKYGLPRILGITEINRAGDFKGTDVFVEAGSTAPVAEVIYIPVRRGCEFQPYLKVDPPCVANLSLVPSVKKIKKGKNVVVSIKTPIKGKVTYKWTVNSAVEGDGAIIGPKNGKSITISTKKMPAGESFSVYLEVSINGKKCEPVEAFTFIEVIR
ncbi:MAG: hypothetical protein K0Q66_1927 [Chitinophagaceae bacterium]|nr:hypothetical protein [Chitinophagaceae bacterium]